jgi:hypothetical protein
VLRAGQPQKILVREGLDLQLSSISLNEVASEDSEDTAVSVKVWLDYDHQSTLLCTLRPERCEQVATNITLLGSEAVEDQAAEPHVLRMEVLFQQQGKRKRAGSVVSASQGVRDAAQGYEVHILGKTAAVHTHDEEDEEDENDQTCPL